MNIEKFLNNLQTTYKKINNEKPNDYFLGIICGINTLLQELDFINSDNENIQNYLEKWINYLKNKKEIDNIYYGYLSIFYTVLQLIDKEGME